MKKRTVSYSADLLPPLTAVQKRKLRSLANLPEKNIDLSEIPEMSATEWKNAERGHFYRPVQRQITARVDADVIEWLKSHGKGYQSRMNAILRREMLGSSHRSK